MRVRIIGGGVGGFACALALNRITGLDDIQVFERGPEVLAAEKSGHGLMVMGNGVAALRVLGAETILEGSNPLTRAVFQDQRQGLDQLEEVS